MMTKSLIPSQWQVPKIFHERLGQRYGRQRTMLAEDHLLLVLHEVPDPSRPERSGLLFWRSPQGDWKSTAGSGIAQLRELIGRYVTRIDELESRVEGATRAAEFYEVLKAANPLKRSATNLHQALQQAREALPDERELIDLRDSAGEVQRAAELVNDEARIGLDFETASASEEQNAITNRLARSSQRLNLIAALFLPLTAITSVFGMNLPSGFERYQTPTAFWIVLVVAVGAGFFLRGQVDREA
jgi:hypothetical protein